MSILFDNNASATLSVQAEIVDTTLTLQTNEGGLFPTPSGADFFICTLEDTSGNIEIVTCSDNTADVLTVTRGTENTSAAVFAVGSKVELRTTAATFAEFIQRSGDTMTGTLDVDGNDLQDPVITSTGTGEIKGLPIRGTDGGTANQLIVPTAAGAPTIGTDEIWHEGNDGPGTGLDADTLDGDHAAAFVKEGDATVDFTGVVTLDGDVTTADYGTGGRVKDGNDVSQPIGYNVMPPSEQDASASVSLAVNGHLLHRDGAGAADYTLPNDGDIPVGATWTVANDTAAAGLFRVKGATGVTVKWFDQTNKVVTTVVAANGFTLEDACVATIYKYTDTIYFLWGGAIIESV